MTLPPSGVNFTAFEQVEHDLLHGAAVGAQSDRGLDLGIHRQLLLGGTCRDEAERFRQEAVELYHFRFEVGAAGFDLRHVEDVVDDVEQVAAAFLDVAAVFEILLVTERPEQACFHHLGEADDGVERRAQFVAHVGEERRLRLARLLGAILLFRIALGEIREAARSAVQAPAGTRAGRRRLPSGAARSRSAVLRGA